MIEKDNQIIDGEIECIFYSSDNLSIKNNLIYYDCIKIQEIISEYEAYKMIENGNFALNQENDNITQINITNVELDYMLDSKNYYQPVYRFDVYINGENTIESIYIPALS